MQKRNLQIEETERDSQSQAPPHYPAGKASQGGRTAKRPWGLTFAAVVLLILGALALLGGLAFPSEGHYATRDIALTIQGILTLTSGVLILLHHKYAVRVTLVCAILFTLGCIFHALVALDVALEIIQVALIWMGFTWYAQWRNRIDAQMPVASPLETLDTDLN